ncbi:MULTISPECIES: hypothetical protein [Thioalkalivibrio]|uniref:hypothetical protein n=1 Tax=Thioalkalivibrio TaxID=106633 RepID=UPI00037D001E|nr:MULTISPECIES: hypothetical protein [Thioalkalivibrio]
MKQRPILQVFTSFDSVAEALRCGFSVLDSRTAEPVTEDDLGQLSITDLDHLQLQVA